MQIRAHAETKPLVPNNSRDNRSKNRRVEIVIVGNNYLFEGLHNTFSVEDVEQVSEVPILPESG